MVYKIVNQGMGGFLNPPGHPEHNFSVIFDGSSLSLSYALEQTWIPEELKEQVKAKLNEWVKHDLQSPEIQDWCLRVLGYFKSCYCKVDRKSWNVSDLEIDKRNPMENIDLHAGVNLIRQFYPEFTPTEECFKNARWGE